VFGTELKSVLNKDNPSIIMSELIELETPLKLFPRNFILELSIIEEKFHPCNFNDQYNNYKAIKRIK
jgi:hypothetical protein